jgi:radical SAM protein with 4Fe4S-binding SPASM domain
MVKAPGPLRRLWGSVRGDVERCAVRVQALRTPPLAPGLYSYRLARGEDRLHLHLRLHPDRSALLFVNGVEAHPLPPTFAEMLKLTLDGLDPEATLARLELAYPQVGRARLAADLGRTEELVGRLWAGGSPEDCPWCDLGLEVPARRVPAQAPYKADVALHYDCNNHCAHCYNEPGRRQPSLSAAEWRQALRRLWAIGVPYVIFTGGEPTLHPDLPELVAYASELGQITGLNTNGRRLDAGLCRALREAGLDHVQITLHSDRPEVHNALVGAAAWEETVAGIRCGREAGLHTLTNTTLVKASAGRAPELVEFLHGLGLRTFAMNGIIHSGCGAGFPGALGESELRPVLERVRDCAAELGMRFLWYTPTRYCRLSPLELGLGPKTCNAAEYSICVEPDGAVLPCQSYYEPVGNLLRDPWESLWESGLFRRLRERRECPEAAGLPARCAECEALETCGGGCPLERVKRSRV